ncbi:MAG TPA: VOC family protein [Reyranella sp.]|nr:VOC family protein [Reyranella sp.]
MTTEIQAASEELLNEAKTMNGLAPYLSAKDAPAQIEFYKKAFDAVEIARMPAQDGKRLMHAHIRINGTAVLLSDCFPEWGYPFKEPQGVMLHIQVGADPQAWWDRAVAAGCEVLSPMEVQFWGDRYGQLKDPFGFTWTIGGPA